MDAADGYGLEAYACPRDQNFLVTIPDAEGVLPCAACGHRTDEPGSGMLVDAFDVAHRQFGLRGDVHAWNAIRELVVTTPTRPIADAALVVFVDALRQVADVDLDHTDEQQVYREHLNHGGMSGASIDIEWWRTRGIPLLVDRAITRRPAPSPCAAGPAFSGAEKGGSLLGSILVWVVLLAIPVAPSVAALGCCTSWPTAPASRRPCWNATRRAPSLAFGRSFRAR